MQPTTDYNMLGPSQDGKCYEIQSPTAMPAATTFLWNKRMMVQLNCRGYVTAQFMQPDPARYAHAPLLEAKTFMQPEQSYYTEHPGRFVYVKDEETQELFSVPYEPCRATLDSFVFSAGKSLVSWLVESLGVRVQLQLHLAVEDAVELWSVQVTNVSGRHRKISIVPFFPIGNMSWMNQSAEYRRDLVGVVASSITAYQKVEDYEKNRTLKDKTYLLSDVEPDAWETSHAVFAGEGGLQHPSALGQGNLSCGDARYENLVAALQYRLSLQPNNQKIQRLLFGPAQNDAEIAEIRRRYLSPRAFHKTTLEYEEYMEQGKGFLHLETPDEGLNDCINNWLPRQVYYHGDINRLTTDPQTRNYLQDNMGMCYINPSVTKGAILKALSQQEPSGAMPDGILLHPSASLNYINQIPHTDQCVWLPIVMQAYLCETGDMELLDHPVHDDGDNTRDSMVFARISRAVDHLISSASVSPDNLSYIGQGDWCDPLNMAGPQGIGTSGWLTLATAHALNIWADICKATAHADLASRYQQASLSLQAAANKHFWVDKSWYARGITDSGTPFGIPSDPEGSIWLNPQSFALLSGAIPEPAIPDLLSAIDTHLLTPYGPVMLAPAYTSMRPDIGRVTQKHPGVAENGSVYNHAASFYIYALYRLDRAEYADRAFDVFMRMIPFEEEDCKRRGQLPLFIPNYYRGAYKEFPRFAGRSSQLVHTGSAAWVLRIVVEELCGVRGEIGFEGVIVRPRMPKAWDGMKFERIWRGAVLDVQVKREDVEKIVVEVDGNVFEEGRVTGLEKGKKYKVEVRVPLIEIE